MMMVSHFVCLAFPAAFGFQKNWSFPLWDFCMSPIVVSVDLLSGCYFRRNLVTRIFRLVLYYAVHCDWVCCSLCFSGRSFGYCPSLYLCFPLGRGYICLCFGFLLKMGWLIYRWLRVIYPLGFFHFGCYGWAFSLGKWLR